MPTTLTATPRYFVRTKLLLANSAAEQQKYKIIKRVDVFYIDLVEIIAK